MNALDDFIVAALQVAEDGNHNTLQMLANEIDIAADSIKGRQHLTFNQQVTLSLLSEIKQVLRHEFIVP